MGISETIYMCEKMNSSFVGKFNYIYIYIYWKDLALNDMQWFIYHKLFYSGSYHVTPDILEV